MAHSETIRAPGDEPEPGSVARPIHLDVPLRPLSDEGLGTALPLLDSLSHPVVWIEPNHQISWSNAAARARFYGTSGKCHTSGHHRPFPCARYGGACPVRAATELGTAVSVAHVHQVGATMRFFEVAAVPILGGRTVELHVLVEEFFGTDALTGVRTRAYFEQSTRRALALMQRIELPFVVVMIDPDRFRHLNGQNGHPAGDLVLQSVGRAILDNIRATDSVGRWGSDEFCVFFPVIGHHGRVQLVSRIQQAIRSIQLRSRGHAVPTSARFGIHSSCSVYSFVGAIRRADAALYRAKEAGRDCIEIWV